MMKCVRAGTITVNQMENHGEVAPEFPFRRTLVGRNVAESSYELSFEALSFLYDVQA